MKYDREFYEWKTEDLTGAERFFKRLAHADPADPKYAAGIRAAREMVGQNTVVKAVFRRIRIISRDENGVTLEDGFRLTGRMPAVALEKAEELYAFVVTLKGFENVKSDDMLLNFYTDTWGSAFTERGQNALGNIISEKAEAEGMKRTHMWCPGQHTFELSNQTALFGMLHPEDIGCALTESMMMVPVKSSSGIIGIVPEDTENMPMPCDYCPFNKKCHPESNGCPAV